MKINNADDENILLNSISNTFMKHHEDSLANLLFFDEYAEVPEDIWSMLNE